MWPKKPNLLLRKLSTPRPNAMGQIAQRQNKALQRCHQVIQAVQRQVDRGGGAILSLHHSRSEQSSEDAPLLSRWLPKLAMLRPFPDMETQNSARIHASLHLKFLSYIAATRSCSPKSRAVPVLPGRRVLVHEHLNGTLILRVHDHLCLVARPCHRGSLLQGGPLFVI